LSSASHHFQSPNSPQTLAEGLAEYFAANPGLKRDAQLLSPDARQFFRSHDAVHVVYGCGTTMPDEAIVKLASLFGTTGGLGVLRGYAHHETLDIYRKLPVGETALAILASPFLIARTAWRCMRQARRWPWDQYDDYLDMPLREIRARFGIKVARG
jgi:hypothetical protein